MRQRFRRERKTLIQARVNPSIEVFRCRQAFYVRNYAAALQFFSVGQDQLCVSDDNRERHYKLRPDFLLDDVALIDSTARDISHDRSLVAELQMASDQLRCTARVAVNQDRNRAVKTRLSRFYRHIL